MLNKITIDDNIYDTGGDTLSNIYSIIIDTVFPIGSTTIRTDNVDPSTLYTGTTWQKISEGKVLIGADNTYPLGSSANGSMTHNHTNPTTNGSSAANTGGTTLNAAQSGNQAQTITSGGMSANDTHSHNAHSDTSIKFMETKLNVGVNGTARPYPSGSGAVHYVYVDHANYISGEGIGEYASTTSTNIAHTHSVSVGAKNAIQSHDHSMLHTHTQGNTGDATIPYLAVNIWVRTA